MGWLNNNKKGANLMNTTVTIGKRLIPLEQIALVEPFDPAASPDLKSDKAYRSRVVLLDRDSVLCEMDPLAFAEQYAFRVVLEDNVATNPAVRFGVESFSPQEGFMPMKPYRTRLTWRDGNSTRSKLLLASPEIVLAVSVRGEDSESSEAEDEPSRRRRSSKQLRRESRRRAPDPEPA
jgi:hypothetical protein